MLPECTHAVAATAFVTNAAGEVLMVKSPWRGWELPGGLIEKGETLIDGLRREIREETGVDIAVSRLVTIAHHLDAPESIGFTFTAEFVSGALKTSSESLQAEWVPRNELVSRVEKPWIRDHLDRILRDDPRPRYAAFTGGMTLVDGEPRFGSFDITAEALV